jgi:hypothetical protein
MNLILGFGIEADHDAVAGARRLAIEGLADPDGLAFTRFTLRVADRVDVVGELLPADGAEDGVVENFGPLDVDGADGDVADHGSLPAREPSLAGKWNKSRTKLQHGRFKQPAQRTNAAKLN